MISFMIAISLFAVLSTTMTNMVSVTGFATVPLTTRTATMTTVTTTLEATPFLFGFLNKKDDNDDNDKSAVVNNKNKKASATTTKKNIAVNKAAKKEGSSGSVKNTNTYNSRSK